MTIKNKLLDASSFIENAFIKTKATLSELGNISVDDGLYESAKVVAESKAIEIMENLQYAIQALKGNTALPASKEKVLEVFSNQNQN